MVMQHTAAFPSSNLRDADAASRCFAVQRFTAWRCTVPLHGGAAIQGMAVPQPDARRCPDRFMALRPSARPTNRGAPSRELGLPLSKRSIGAYPDTAGQSEG